MERLKRYFGFRTLDKVIAVSAAILSILAFLGVDKNLAGGVLAESFEHTISVPTVSIVLLGIAVIYYIKLQHALRTKRFSEKYQHNTIALSGYASALRLSPVNESICGLYMGLRRVGAPDNIKYFLQFLIVTKVAENDFRFLLYDNYDGKEWYIEGSCIKVQNSLVFKGAIDCQRDAVHSLYIKCPTHAHSDQLEGLITLTRLDETSAMSTRVMFKKITSITSIGTYPKDAFKSSKLGESDFELARVYNDEELIDVMPSIRFFNDSNVLNEMKLYIDEAPVDPYVVHS